MDMPRSRQGLRCTQRLGMTLIEVMVSAALMTVIIVGALSVRYYAVKHAVRADAYETAGRIGQLFLEGWRSTALDAYEPYSVLGSQIQMTPSDDEADGPNVTVDGFTPYVRPPNNYVCYDVVENNRHYHVALGYTKKNGDASGYAEYVIHATVAFLNNYGSWGSSDVVNYVKLSSYKQAYKE
jgi:type II secretory pathway pseudopilin PulG